MNIIYKEVETRKYIRTNKETGKSEVVTVSNRNDLSVEEHLRLLNLNDNVYIYSGIEE